MQKKTIEYVNIAEYQVSMINLNAQLLIWNFTKRINFSLRIELHGYNHNQNYNTIQFVILC